MRYEKRLDKRDGKGSFKKGIKIEPNKEDVTYMTTPPKRVIPKREPNCLEETNKDSKEVPLYELPSGLVIKGEIDFSAPETPHCSFNVKGKGYTYQKGTKSYIDTSIITKKTPKDKTTSKNVHTEYKGSYEVDKGGDYIITLKVMYPNDNEYSIVEIKVNKRGLHPNEATKCAKFLHTLLDNPYSKHKLDMDFKTYLRTFCTYTEYKTNKKIQKRKIKCKFQYKEFNRIFDFYFTKIGVTLELDGKEYHREEEDKEKDVTKRPKDKTQVRVSSKDMLIYTDIILDIIVERGIQVYKDP